MRRNRLVKKRDLEMSISSTRELALESSTSSRHYEIDEIQPGYIFARETNPLLSGARRESISFSKSTTFSHSHLRNPIQFSLHHQSLIDFDPHTNISLSILPTISFHSLSPSIKSKEGETHNETIDQSSDRQYTTNDRTCRSQEMCERLSSLDVSHHQG